MADWPWLARLSSIGTLLHEPEILTRKHSRKSGVAGTCRQDADAYRAVSATVAQEIRASGLSLPDKPLELAALARFQAYWLIHKRPGNTRRWGTRAARPPRPACREGWAWNLTLPPLRARSGTRVPTER